MKWILLLIVAVAVGAWYFISRAPQFVDHPREGSTIIAFGDSLTAGFGASPGHDYPALLSARLGMRVVNAGVSGDTTGSAKERLRDFVLDQDPRIVILFLGGNDVLHQTPPDEAFGNLRDMIDRIHNEGAGVLLVGIRGRGIFSDQYMDGYQKLAREKKVSFVPDILNGIFGNSDLMNDEVHPNDKGYAIIADRLEPALRKMLQ